LSLRSWVFVPKKLGFCPWFFTIICCFSNSYPSIFKGTTITSW